MKSTFALLPLVGLLAMFGAPGCASETADEQPETTDDALAVSVHNPSGAYVAKVNANGTGCQAGTWDATISRDGKELEIEFSNYTAEVREGEAFSVKDCIITVDLRTPRGSSFAIKKVAYEGHAELDRGVTASLDVKYYFQGNPMQSTPIAKTLTGPFDDSFTLGGEIADRDLAWSPCGTTRFLNAQSRVFMRNSQGRRGAGSATLSENKLKTRLHLAWRSC